MAYRRHKTYRKSRHTNHQAPEPVDDSSGGSGFVNSLKARFKGIQEGREKRSTERRTNKITQMKSDIEFNKVRVQKERLDLQRDKIGAERKKVRSSGGGGGSFFGFGGPGPQVKPAPSSTGGRKRKKKGRKKQQVYHEPERRQEPPSIFQF